MKNKEIEERIWPIIVDIKKNFQKLSDLGINVSSRSLTSPEGIAVINIWIDDPEFVRAFIKKAQLNKTGG